MANARSGAHQYVQSPVAAHHNTVTHRETAKRCDCHVVHRRPHTIAQLAVHEHINAPAAVRSCCNAAVPDDVDAPLWTGSNTGEPG